MHFTFDICKPARHGRQALSNILSTIKTHIRLAVALADACMPADAAKRERLLAGAAALSGLLRELDPPASAAD